MSLQLFLNIVDEEKNKIKITNRFEKFKLTNKKEIEKRLKYRKIITDEIDKRVLKFINTSKELFWSIMKVEQIQKENPNTKIKDDKTVDYSLNFSRYIKNIKDQELLKCLDNNLYFDVYENTYDLDYDNWIIEVIYHPHEDKNVIKLRIVYMQ